MSPLPRPRLRRPRLRAPDRPHYRPGDAMRRWRAFQEQQRVALRESNQFPSDTSLAPTPEPAEPRRSTGGATPLGSAEGGDGPTPERPRTAEGTTTAYGSIGKPINRASPIYVGFMAAIGVALAYALVHLITRLTTTLTVLLVAFFLTLALNPIVESLCRRGMRRSGAVTVVCLGLIGVFALLAWLVVPPLVQETTELGNNAPHIADDFLAQRWVKDLDQNYDIGTKVQAEMDKRINDGAFVSQVFGGVLGAGKAVASGLFQAFTILILTLYFLASLPRVKQAAYAMVPATRRPRFISLSEEIMRRVGSYAIGQVLVATINAACSWIMMTILGIPYAAVLAVVVGFLGLIPMVGATLGAVLVAVVAFFVEPQKAIVVGVYYLIYQQVENYLIVPRVMQRTVAVPGAVTVVAALAGGTLLGVLGALLAIPVAAGLLLLYEEVLVPRQEHQ
ncbi:AI-2E family transporter [Luteipulveratus flavus]|uniref:AI-2E family transporter n=1 Tax=Luteipulveratus flavus TaxID=3031728 RepID=A0ABT6C8Q8_9MICO|nr:AI-2E family transporter [Luteipulveratus sp. YIM 133296]MDF8264913.1 AI-2E family transporter [Luteipulveratus sp. YIM 133296]